MRIIKPSVSPFSFPMLLIKKKDGMWCFYADYNALNAIAIKDCIPIPTIDNMLDELQEATFFTKLNLTFDYHRVRVHPPDTYKTAFRTHNDH